MELRVLNYFLVIANEKNFTKASQLLHITQPTLSRQIAQLEKELGTKLFIRNNHNISLTEDGLILKRRAQEILSLADKTVKELSYNERNIEMPLESQCTTTLEDRLEKGIEAQATIFGEHMNETWKAGTINKWLVDNCFGDYYTRKGLTLAEREMITFCFLSAQGSCEPQLIAHSKGNMNMGNDKEFLIKVVLQCVPYIGYPRSLNAINCINKACE